MTRAFKVYQTIISTGIGNTLLHEKQYDYNDIEIGKHIIANKIENQRIAISKKRGKSIFDQEAIESLNLYEAAVYNACNKRELMGIEGIAAKTYFQQIFDNCLWSGRKPRIKSDWINSTLDIGYNILFNLIEAMAVSFGFDIYRGVLHSDFYMRKSLVCDLVEPFRPIVDICIRKAIKLKQFKENDFKVINHRFVLSWEKSPYYCNVIISVLLERKEDIFVYIRDYYRAFMKQQNAENFPIFKL